MKCSCDNSGNAPRPCYDVTWCVSRIDPKVHVTFLEVTWMQSKLNLHFWIFSSHFYHEFQWGEQKGWRICAIQPIEIYPVTWQTHTDQKTRVEVLKRMSCIVILIMVVIGNQGFLWTYASSFLNFWISISIVSCMSCTSQQWCKGAWPWVWSILPEIPLPSSSSSPASP